MKVWIKVSVAEKVSDGQDRLCFEVEQGSSGDLTYVLLKREFVVKMTQ